MAGFFLLGAISLGSARCASTSVPATGDTALDLRHEDPRVRAAAAKRAVLEGRKDLIPLLVANLSDPDGAVRLFTAVALRKLTGEDHGYNPSDPPGARARAVEEWNAWLASPARTAESPGATPAPGPADSPDAGAPPTDPPDAPHAGALPAGSPEDLGWKP